MNTTFAAFLIAVSTLLSGCGEPIRGVNEDAKAAKAQAHEAVDAAADAARRVDELSRAPVDEAAGAH